MQNCRIELYTFKIVRHYLWFGYHYQIMFEETPVRELLGWTHDQVKDYVHMLNTAWNLGFDSGAIVANIQSE